jgi:hypothetical protein
LNENRKDKDIWEKGREAESPSPLSQTLSPNPIRGGEID